MYTAGGGASFKIAGPFSLGLGTSYSYYDAVYNGLGVSVYGRLDYARESRERPVRD
ncbi:MAG: hypothetical protein PQJ58_15785 [Spirochaetales bacterium]|nr:hypothetical protein [Spirochaetales bacterium]